MLTWIVRRRRRKRLNIAIDPGDRRLIGFQVDGFTRQQKAALTGFGVLKLRKYRGEAVLNLECTANEGEAVLLLIGKPDRAQHHDDQQNEPDQGRKHRPIV